MFLNENTLSLKLVITANQNMLNVNFDENYIYLFNPTRRLISMLNTKIQHCNDWFFLIQQQLR